MSFFPWPHGYPLSPNRYGIGEPQSEHTAAVQKCDIDVALIPLVAYDEQGNRLGMGGGYYDRFFSRQSWGGEEMPPRIGVAYGFQKYEQLPVQAWDVPLNYVATESVLVKFGGSQSGS